MKCPACRSLMLVVEHDGIELDHCPACAGTWFDRDELALLLDETTGAVGGQLSAAAVAALPAAATREQRRPCPACRQMMHKANIGPGGRVLADVCPAGHGLWFDNGEVATLAADLKREGKDLPARALSYLGEVIRRGDAATQTEDR
jgi:Zn-finger nucleic acid-binding protein